MNDDELKAIWKASNSRMQQINIHSININNMNERIKKFEKSIRRRNNLEILAAICLIAVFLVFAYVKPAPLAKIGALFTIAYCLNVIYQLRRTEAKQPNFDMTRSLKEQLIEYQAYVKEEQKLLINVLYWYLLPLLPGMILFLIGTGTTLIAGFIYFGIIVPLGFSLIYYLNRKAVKYRTQPLLNDITKILASLEKIAE